MPELPEVETALNGISPHITGQTVTAITVRQAKLRYPVPPDLAETLIGQTVRTCRRRAKYMLIEFDTGVMLMHLGMSGTVRIFHQPLPDAAKHDHIDWHFDNGTLLRYHDPRRFGMVLWYAGVAEHHPLLAKLGVEPLESDFTPTYLHHTLIKQSRPIKTALMDNAVVVGVGNIYANESLFLSGIQPHRPAQSLSFTECTILVDQIQTVLQKAIAAGGSTLRDFVNSEGNSGYFQQQYYVYGRQGQPCRHCGTPITKTILGQRGTFYCPICQN